MAERIAITSVGIISALGKGIDAHTQALYNKVSGLKYAVHLQTKHSKEFPLGEIDASNDQLSTQLGLPIGHNGYTRTTLLALMAMKELLSDIPAEVLNESKYAFINANTVGGMCSVEDMYLDFISPAKEGYFKQYIDTLDCAESTLNVSKYYKLKPFTATLSTACSSSANAVLLGSRMIQAGLVERAICGGCDALSRFTLNGFNSLKNVSREHCTPFDQERIGLNLGEGAGYILLEKESDAIKRNATILGYLSGYGNSNDAYHPTAPSPEGDGALLTMQLALEKAKLNADDISYINAHGTATLNNDSAEGKAIQRLFDADTPFSSTKPYTGHTLAAAGVIEAIFSLIALQQQKTIPNLNFQNRMEELSISPVTDIQEMEINHVLSNSFGFGGNNVSLIFSRA